MKRTGKNFPLASIVIVSAIAMHSFAAQEIGEPLVDSQLGATLKTSYARLEIFNINTVVYNGNVSLLGTGPSLAIIDGMALGTLNAAELRFLRNTIYAIHGYIFKSADLDSHFRRFPWYAPKSDNVDAVLSQYEKQFIEAIKRYETPIVDQTPISSAFLVGKWEEYNGGADQEGNRIELKSDGTFVYHFADWESQRTGSLMGTWVYSPGRLRLDVARQDFALGGYYTMMPDDIVLKGAIPGTINYQHTFMINLPVNRFDPPKNTYPSGTWLSIGLTRMMRLGQ